MLLMQNDTNISKTWMKKEWLETNKLGGYASSSILGYHTRKYHGWLVTEIPEHNNRFVLVSKVNPTIEVDNKKYELVKNEYSDNAARFIKSFDINSVPITKFEVPELGVSLEQSLMLLKNENTLIVKYKLEKSKTKVKLNLMPLLSYRMVHVLGKENSDLYTVLHDTNKKNIKKISPYFNMPELYIGSDSSINFVEKSNKWVKNLNYREEKSRGYDYQEDLFSLFDIEKQLQEKEELFLYISTKNLSTPIKTMWNEELKRRNSLKEKFKIKLDPIGSLKISADMFLVDNKRIGKSIKAGFPWFEEWSRDSMVSLPGLTFYSDRVEEGFSILKSYSTLVKDGLLPNKLPIGKTDMPEYNSADGSFWYFWAIQQYYKKTKDISSIKKHLKKSMDAIIRAYVNGVVPIAELTQEGLIWSGLQNSNVTWMDANIEGNPITSRYGYAVEINALWFNAICFYKQMYKLMGEKLTLPVDEIISLAKKSFINKFWNENKLYLADTVNENGEDYSVRPNQIFAVSLPFSMLNMKQKVSVVKIVQKELITPYGLRTLSPQDTKYRGKYVGNVVERDHAYHQGTIWPWLIAHFSEAFLKVVSPKKNGAKYLKKYFKPLFTSHLDQYGMLSIAEIFDGDKPHEPNGCIAQAWSVAETIRAYEILNKEVK